MPPNMASTQSSVAFFAPRMPEANICRMRVIIYLPSEPSLPLLPLSLSIIQINTKRTQYYNEI